MPNAKVNLLVVDDDAALRMSLSNIFAASGHHVRSATDGFSALSALRLEIPDIILSDLNMPGMSGFEFLSVVRRRFPAIRVIAMSSGFSTEGLPLGIAADAFYQKGDNLGSLMQIMEGMTNPEQPPSLKHAATPAPIWVERTRDSSSAGGEIMLTCPECLRTFPQVSHEAQCPVHETGCIFCNSPVHYAIVQTTDPESGKAASQKQAISQAHSI